MRISFEYRCQKLVLSLVVGSQIIKLCVNLNPAILRCNAVTSSADIGEPSAVFNLAVVGCMGVL